MLDNAIVDVKTVDPIKYSLLQVAHDLAVPVTFDVCQATVLLGNKYEPRRVNINLLDWPGRKAAIALAHELGHVLDWNARPWAYEVDIDLISGHIIGYHYATWMSRMDLELTAWDYALRMLRDINIDTQMWDLFEEMRAYGLESHNGAFNPWTKHGLERG